MSKAVECRKLIKDAMKLVPVLMETSHKGNCGRIGIFGGSVEFSGAPYFSGMSALRTGADLAYVFCAASASQSIKSYSPELMVCPFLDSDDAALRIRPWLKKMHSVVIGPGLGRHETVFTKVKDIIEMLKVTPTESGRFRPMILDADALHFLTHNPTILKDYLGQVYLTPNCVEFDLLVSVFLGNKYEQPTELLMKRLCQEIGENVTIMLKGNVDLISDSKLHITSDAAGSLRRCGGQGDILSGILATFSAWSALRIWSDSPPASDVVPDHILAVYAASFLTRTCSKVAFGIHSRSMLASDMIKELPAVFKAHFDSPVFNSDNNYENLI